MYQRQEKENATVTESDMFQLFTTEFNHLQVLKYTHINSFHLGTGSVLSIKQYNVLILNDHQIVPANCAITLTEE